MKLQYLLLFSLMTCGVLCGAQTPAPTVTPAEFNATVRNIQYENRVSGVFDHAKIHEAYLRWMAEAPLNDVQKSTLWGNIFSNAVSAPELFADAKKKVQSLPDAKFRQTVWNAVLSTLAGPRGTEETLAAAEKLFAEEDVRRELSPQIICRTLGNFAHLHLTIFGDAAAYEKIFKEIRNFPAADGLPENEKKLLAAEKERTAAELLRAYVEYDPEEADKFITSQKLVLNDNQRNTILRACIVFSVRNENRKLFDSTLKKIRALEPSKQKTDLLIAAAQSFKDAAILEDLLKSDKLSAYERFQVIDAIRRIVSPSSFIYAVSYKIGSYEKLKEYAILGDKLVTETNEAIKAGEKGIVRIPDYPAFAFYSQVADLAYAFGDYAFGDQMLEKALAHNRSKNALSLLLEQRIRKDDVKGAIAVCEELMSMKGVSAAENETFSAMKYFLEGGTFDGFDAAFKEKNFTSARKMNLIRSCARIFFRAKKFDRSRALDHEVLDKMFREPDTKKVYTVRFVSNPPKTAGAWAKTPFYNDWNIMEQRFSVYNGYQESEKVDIRAFLKDSPELKLKDEYRTGLHILCSEEGVHFFLRCNDPKAEEIMEGKRGYGGLEWVLQPGSEHAYHSIYFSDLPETKEPWIVNWSAVTKHYRLTYDYITKDAVVTKEGVAAHMFVPWLMVWDKLPSDDNVWKVGLQVWGPDPRSLSGIVHELERCLRLKFELTPEQTILIKRKIAKMAFNRYNALRRDPGEKILTWNDPVLGDPAFYESVVAPFIKELDDAGERLMKPAPDAEIPELYEKFVPLWAEINIVLSEKRGEYLKRKFMETK